jgi:hypothetical protein
MGVVIEKCMIYPRGPTELRGLILSVRINSKRIWLFGSGERGPI